MIDPLIDSLSLVASLFGCVGGGGCVVNVLGTWTSMCRGGWVGPVDIIDESSIC